MFARDIGIDLGTANVLIHVKGQGIVLNEPSVVAIDEIQIEFLPLVKKLEEWLDEHLETSLRFVQLKDGVIADFEVTEAMLKHFINKLNVKGFLSKPRILICCPTNITSVEQKAIREAAEKSGGKKIYLEEEPKVAAIGAGMDISSQAEIWSLTSEAERRMWRFLSMGDIVTSSSIKMAGDKFDSGNFAITSNEKYKLLIGERTSEDIKINIGTVFQVRAMRKWKFADVTW